MKLREFTNGSPAWIAADAHVEEASRLMNDHDCRLLPVLDGSHAVGVVHRDAVNAAMGQGDNWQGGRCVSEIMRPAPIAVNVDDEDEEAIRRMMAFHVPHVLVFDRDRLVGVVTVDDLAGRLRDDRVEEAMRYIAAFDPSLGDSASPELYVG